MKRLLIASFISLLSATVLIAQGSGTPNTLRVLTDANGYLVIVGATQTNPTTQTVFSNTRLKTDANGYLQVVNTGGTFTGSQLGPSGACTAGNVTYSFTSATSTGLFLNAPNDPGICANGTLRFNADSTNTNVRGPDGGAYLFVGNGSVTVNSATLKLGSLGGVSASADADWLYTNNAGTAGIRADFSTDGTLFIKSRAAADTAILKSNKLNLTGAISNLGNVTTAGSFGAPPITAVAETTGLTGADTNRINYTPAAASSTYELSGVVNVTAWATPASFTVVTTYKDASGNSRTDTALVVRGSTGATAAAVTAIDRWYFNFPAIDIDNSATAITLSTTGTFTGSPVYNFQGTLRRVR